MRYKITQSGETVYGPAQWEPAAFSSELRGLGINVSLPGTPALIEWGSIAIVEDASPEPEPVPAVPEYDKLKIVEAIDGMGKLEDFAGMMATAPLKIQMRWQAAGSLKGDDEDFLAVLGMIQQAWEKTDVEMKQILSTCAKV